MYVELHGTSKLGSVIPSAYSYHTPINTLLLQEPQSTDYIAPMVDDGREFSVEDTSINFTVGSECTFGGCYIDFSPIGNMDEWYNVYWIEPVTCIISKLVTFY